MMRRWFFYFLVLIVFQNSWLCAQNSDIDHWETVVQADQVWRYFPGNSEPALNWKDSTFNDESWLTGQGGIGYSDGDDITEIDPVVSLYLRKTFNLSDTSSIVSMIFHMDYDDGFVAYLNGVEIARSNVNGSPPAFNTVSGAPREATMYMGGFPDEYQISKQFINQNLSEGDNILAIQVHNTDITSSDMSAIPFLTLGTSDTTWTFSSPPLWFTPPMDDNVSELPIISINTLGQTIVDDPRIVAEMSVIDNGVGQLNNLDDPPTGYEGRIIIEIKGESAQMFPKKSYSFETQDSIGENRNVPLLGLPEENDWILYAPYSDKTLIKNVLSYKLTRDMGRYATRTKYCEVFINGFYKGLYVLMEKIKRDSSRVDISKLKPEDIDGDQLTGGYIVRIDKVDGNDYPPWVAYPELRLPYENPVTLQFFNPDGDKLGPEQQNYIKDYIRQFEITLSGKEFLSQSGGYHQYVDRDALVDYVIVNELSKNIDAYIFSMYLYKDRDSKGGKLTMGPVWDFNIAYGNVNYNDAAKGIPGWMYEEDYRIYWIRRMMKDWVVKNRMGCRWHELRGNQLSDEKIFGYIDSLIASLENPIIKNFKRWPVLGQYVWPNSFIGDSHLQEIDYLKNWLGDRLNWMDNNVFANCVTSLNENETNNLVVYPNPFKEYIKIQGNKEILGNSIIKIYNTTGQLVKQMTSSESMTGLQELYWDGSDHSGGEVAAGIYIVRIISGNIPLWKGKVIKE